MPVDTGPAVPAAADVDPRAPGRRRAARRPSWSVLAVVAAGGVVGALGRYGIAQAMPHPGRAFPWSTFVTNVTGCLAIGVLMVLVTEVWAAHRLLRPFLGVGMLGGYTTFSSYAVDAQQLILAGAARTALLYLAGTLVAGLVAVYAGVLLTRLSTARRRPR